MTSSKPDVILSVDDNEAGRYATSRILRRAGFEVWEAARGDEALVLATRQPGLVLLDVNLPDMSGFEVCQRLRSDPATRHLPILHLSATNVRPSDRAAGLDGGADGYLVQPVEPSELTAAIRALLRLSEREVQLRAAEARLRTTLRSIGDAVITTDAEGRVELLNPVAETLTGWNEGEARGKKLEEVLRIVSEATRQPAEYPVARALPPASGSGFAEPTLLISRGGTERPISSRAALIRDDDGPAGGAVLVFRDETGERKLVQAQRMDSVGRLAGGIAHDFNNMLAVILGRAALALEGVEPGQPVHAELLEIQKAAQRSADLTRQLLAFARRQTVAPRVLDLNETISDTLGMLRRLIGEDVDLVWRPGADLWPVKIDPSQIDQILTNLVINARDAIEGVGRITLETGTAAFDDSTCADHPSFRPGEYVVLHVSDDGCGMDKDVLAKLFEPFFTTKRAGHGTGLGLSTVYGIVKQNQGFVNVYSEPGAGSTFRIYLPRLIGEDLEIWPRHAGLAPRGRGETVLLVEDEAAVLRLGESMLGRLGYVVISAGTPSEAIRLAREHPGGLDLLLTDVVMPEMNGRELATRLAAVCPGLTCLYTSGYTANVIAHRGILNNGVRFLAKPFSEEDLARAVRRALDGGDEAQGPAGVRGAPARTKGLRVLYVDDDESLVELGLRILGRLGHVVTGYTDPVEAFTQFQRRPADFDVVVTDLAMPKLTGFELAQKLLDVRGDVPIVMTTGYVKEEDEAAARAMGVRALVLKLTTVEELGTALDTLFRSLVPAGGAREGS